MSTATPTRVGIISRTRFRMYRVMGSDFAFRTIPARAPTAPSLTGGRRSERQSLTLGRLLREPDGVELVVQVVARRDLPPVDLTAVGHDPVPLQRHDVVDFLVEEALLELPDERLPLVGVGRARLLFVELVEHAVGVTAVVRRVLVSREEFVDVEVGLDDVAALEIHRHLEVARPEWREIRGRL